MRTIASITLLTFAGIFNVVTPAGADPYAVCLMGGDNYEQCDFSNIAQCRETASGGLGYCVANPTFASDIHTHGTGKREADAQRRPKSARASFRLVSSQASVRSGF